MTWSGSPAPVLPRQAYTSWLARLIAAVIDMIPIAVAWGLWESAVITNTAMDCVTYDNGGRACTSTGPSTGPLVLAVIVALMTGYLVWNFGYRQGRRGSSLGKSVMKFQVVGDKTWQPVGFASSFLRQVVHLVDAVVCFVGFLFPLWDARRQTLADKLMGTVCVPITPRRR